ncbi:MAG: hypothetical protein HQL54_02405 [Magnetococcales bacterium]|nr:hypothetical protein [Magnetococcales bacterium]
MTEIVPRWEWRVFGDDMTHLEEAFRDIAGEPQVRESEEIYILSRRSNNNTKIRFDMMDVKMLKQISKDRLEQWYPTFKNALPVEANQLKMVYQAWDMPIPLSGTRPCDLDTLINTIVEPSPYLESVKVTKERHGFMVNNVICEVGYLTFNGSSIQTAGVEHVDPLMVMSVLKKLGLNSHDNTSYLAALKSFVKMDRLYQ